MRIDKPEVFVKLKTVRSKRTAFSLRGDQPVEATADCMGIQYQSLWGSAHCSLSDVRCNELDAPHPAGSVYAFLQLPGERDVSKSRAAEFRPMRTARFVRARRSQRCPKKDVRSCKIDHVFSRWTKSRDDERIESSVSHSEVLRSVHGCFR